MTEPQEPRGTAPAHLTTEELSECAFSPETAAVSLLEHAEGCPACAAELADLRLLLTELAALPDPEVPESVVVRMDAAIERAWQESDAEQERQSLVTASNARRGRRSFWQRAAVPLASLSLIAVVAVGIGVAVSHTESSTTSAASSAGSAEGKQAAPESDQALTDPTALAWVRSVVPGGTTANSTHVDESPMVVGVHCATPGLPQRSGETVLTSSHREFDGQAATLVVYQDAQKPASPTVFAVVYAGSCPSASSQVLAQGVVSR
ncbi:MAG TPA: hypothetical protein VFN97_08335 [Actinospica sp.]|nr:hypothetical protein [Actinospica sp.]